MSQPLTNRIATVALALAVPIAVLVVARVVGAERSEPSLEMLRSVVEGYAHAIETNNRELALWYVHPISPRRSEINATLRDQLASHLERARTTDLEPLRSSDGAVTARVDQEIVRVFGMKFTRETRRSIYQRPTDSYTLNDGSRVNIFYMISNIVRDGADRGKQVEAAP